MTVGELIATLSGLPPDEPVDWTLDQLQEAIPALLSLEARTAALRFEAVAAFDAGGGARAAGFRSTADWLTKTTGIAHAGAIVHTARALRDDLPETAGALAGGEISEDHVAAIRKAHRMLGEDFAGIEGEVVEVARRTGVKHLNGYLDRIIQQYRPDGSDTDAAITKQKRKAYLSRSLDGWWHLSGLLDPETGERLSAALDVYADRIDEHDDRTPAVRRADALAEIADKAVAQIDRPSGRGHVMITLTEEQLKTGMGAQWPSGTLMTRTDVSRVTCSAQVTTVIGARRGTVWHPVDVGFTERYATRAQRLALQARDGDTCIHGGCSAAVGRCIAHHIVHWRDGGPTSVWNMCLVCPVHHEDLHAGRLIISIRPDGSYSTAPPN